MSLHEYKTSLVINAADYPFYAIIFAAMRQADTENLVALGIAFPEKYKELKQRYNAPGGKIGGEE